METTFPRSSRRGSTFTSWLKKKREEGVKVMYFTHERGRIGGLKSEVGRQGGIAR